MSEGEQYLRRVGLRIRCLRTVHAVSQDRLADKAQVSRVTLGFIERGEDAANLLTCRKLAEALAIDTGDLLTDKDFPWPTAPKT